MDCFVASLLAMTREEGSHHHGFPPQGHSDRCFRELLVDCDDARRRLVYAVISERLKQHSASVQVTADGDTRSRLIWIADVLPHEIAPYVDGQMDQAALAMQKALGRKAA